MLIILNIFLLEKLHIDTYTVFYTYNYQVIYEKH